MVSLKPFITKLPLSIWTIDELLICSAADKVNNPPLINTFALQTVATMALDPEKLAKMGEGARKSARKHEAAAEKARKDHREKIQREKLEQEAAKTIPTPPISNEWIDPTPPKTEEELVKERVKEALREWPWKGLPAKLITVVRYEFVLST